MRRLTRTEATRLAKLIDPTAVLDTVAFAFGGYEFVGQVAGMINFYFTPDDAVFIVGVERGRYATPQAGVRRNVTDVRSRALAAR